MPNAARNPKNHFAALLSAAFLYPFSALYIPPSFFASRFPAAARFFANKNRYSGRMVTISEIDFIGTVLAKIHHYGAASSITVFRSRPPIIVLKSSSYFNSM